MAPSSRSDIAPFVVMDVMEAAASLERTGRRVFHLEVGQPSTSAPRAVLDAAGRALRDDKLGYTHTAGPIIGDGVVISGINGCERYKQTGCFITGHDAETGKELWRAQWPGAMAVPFFAMSNGSWIRATPAYDGESLYVAGMRDVLVGCRAGARSARQCRDGPRGEPQGLAATATRCRTRAKNSGHNANHYRLAWQRLACRTTLIQRCDPACNRSHS